MRQVNIYKNGEIHADYCGVSPLWALATELSLLKLGYADCKSTKQAILEIKLDGNELSFIHNGDKYSTPVCHEVYPEQLRDCVLEHTKRYMEHVYATTNKN